MIFAYGSDTNFDCVRIKPFKLAKLLNLSRKTVCSVLRTFEKQGKNLDTFRDRRESRGYNFDMLLPHVQKELLSQDLLQRWGRYTLADRRHLISQRYGQDISYNKLRNFYLQHGIEWRNTQMVYRSHW